LISTQAYCLFCVGDPDNPNVISPLLTRIILHATAITEIGGNLHVYKAGLFGLNVWLMLLFLGSS